MNRDYTYCQGERCPIKKTCKRYNEEALRALEPLWWLKAPYNHEIKECTALDPKPIRIALNY